MRARLQRDRDAGELARQRAPDAGADHDLVALDAAAARLDRANTPARAIDRQRGGLADELDAELACPRRDCLDERDRTKDAVARHVNAAENQLGVEQGQQLAHLSGRQQARLEPP